MSNISESALERIQFYVTTPYACGYLANQMAQSLIATPQHLVGPAHYSQLIQQGFRRSGQFVYRPHCEHCNACIPVRLPIEKFKASRNQKRAFAKHQDLQVSITPLRFDETQFALYKAYQIARHEGKEAEESAEQYQNFLVRSNVESLCISFSLQGQLKIVSIVDIVEDGVSAVYTFYDTEDSKASYGTFSIIWLTEWCKQLKLPYLYLGYWIQESQKMAYKQNFKPQEALIDGDWQAIQD